MNENRRNSTDTGQKKTIPQILQKIQTNMHIISHPKYNKYSSTNGNIYD